MQSGIAEIIKKTSQCPDYNMIEIRAKKVILPLKKSQRLYYT